MRMLIISIIMVAMTYSCSLSGEKSDAYGNFEAVDVLVPAQGQGILKSFSVEEGMKLKKGQVVGVIDTIQLHLQKQQLLARKRAAQSKLANIGSQVEVQQEQLQTLIVDKNRITRLMQDSAVPARQLDDINGKINVLKKQINSIMVQKQGARDEISAIESQVDQVNDQISRSVIVNPLNGVVLEKYAEPHEMAAPGKTLYKIASMDQLILRIYISGLQLPKIKTGQKVQVLIDKTGDSNQSLEGTITWISPQAEFTPKIIQTKEERVNLVYAVKVSVKNDGRLKIGMPGEVNFNQ
jgi:HlyD family secretion protein